jgi:hypothetical protein
MATMPNLPTPTGSWSVLRRVGSSRRRPAVGGDPPLLAGLRTDLPYGMTHNHHRLHYPKSKIHKTNPFARRIGTKATVQHRVISNRTVGGRR